jgi:hypothetical protein
MIFNLFGQAPNASDAHEVVYMKGASGTRLPVAVALEQASKKTRRNRRFDDLTAVTNVTD